MILYVSPTEKATLHRGNTENLFRKHRHLKVIFLFCYVLFLWFIVTHWISWELVTKCYCRLYPLGHIQFDSLKGKFGIMMILYIILICCKLEWFAPGSCLDLAMLCRNIVKFISLETILASLSPHLHQWGERQEDIVVWTKALESNREIIIPAPTLIRCMFWGKWFSLLKPQSLSIKEEIYFYGGTIRNWWCCRTKRGHVGEAPFQYVAQRCFQHFNYLLFFTLSPSIRPVSLLPF